MHTVHPTPRGATAPIDWLRERVHTPQPPHWPFAALTSSQLRERAEIEARLQAGQLTPFNAHRVQR